MNIKSPMLDKSKHKINISVASILVIWLFVISALIGISLGFEDWFIPKTPLNLLIGFGLLIINLDFSSSKAKFTFVIAFVLGMGVEILGVATGEVFGVYYYGDNMGLKLLGVPYIIGLYWAVLVSATSMIVRNIFNSIFLTAVSGAMAMVILDIFMEVMAGRLDFWHFEKDIVPMQNYIVWFIVAFILHLISYNWIPLKGVKYSLHLYFTQLTFFIVTYLILS